MSLFSTAKAVAVITALGVPTGLVGLPLTFATKNVGWMYRTGQRIANLGIRAAGVQVQVEGRANIPADRPCIFMSNHVSNLDPPALIPMLPGTPSVMLKKSLMSIPVLGPAMRMGKFVPVERDGDRRSAVVAARAAAEAIESGLSLLIFVEGTRSRTGRLLPFKRGPFHLAQSTKAPIVPVVIAGTEQLMEKGSAAITPGTVHIRFLPPVDPAAHPDRNELMQTVREHMIEALPPAMRPLPASAEG